MQLFARRLPPTRSASGVDRLATAPSLRIEPLVKRHDRTGFRCGAEALDLYLRQQARQDAERHVAAPFVLIEPPSAEVLGYYTLSASIIDVAEIAADLARKLPREPQLPVTLVGRLAVHERRKGQGCGALLLMDALHRSLMHAADVAAMARQKSTSRPDQLPWLSALEKPGPDVLTPQTTWPRAFTASSVLPAWAPVVRPRPAAASAATRK